MNLIDLVKLKVKNIEGSRLNYERSKTGNPLSVKITDQLSNILQYYTLDKNEEDFLLIMMVALNTTKNINLYEDVLTNALK